jgi:glutamate synthase domain-containing protein 2
MTVRQFFVISCFIGPLLILVLSWFWPPVLWLFILVVPYIFIGLYDITQKKRTVLRIYPVIGHIRYLFEYIRPEIQQYFVETELNGTPISREFRSLAYQRAKKQTDTRPFGTIIDTYNSGYEWINHGMAPQHLEPDSLRLTFGEGKCNKPYSASPLNISAMSYGALSKNAVKALNRGASLGNFSQNTGEGGITDYHRKFNGDLVWQIGTGYFGCRDSAGNFNAELFASKATEDQVKMIEIKISQGAKPGHGGLLPGAKVSEEVALIRNVEIGKDVISPAYHSAFSNPLELMQYIVKLKKLSGGKPVGFKLCLGNKSEFLGICKAMLETGITPDFITVDGGEGGTGAAPIELTNSVGTPVREGLSFIHNALRGVGMRDEVKLIAAGKLISAFHMMRLAALGADSVNSARGMMFALGCIQARHCNTDKCPTGITTQNPARYNLLDVTDKGVRVFNYHQATVKMLAELVSLVGVDSLTAVKPHHINRRINQHTIQTYEDIYPDMETGFLLNDAKIPDNWQRVWDRADSGCW